MSLEARRSGDAVVRVHLLTWDYAVLAVQAGYEPAVLVPRSAVGLEAFLDRVEAGAEDRWLHRVTTRRPAPVLRRVPRRERSAGAPA